MTQGHKHKHGKGNWIQRFVRWFFGSPFRALPPEFGDPVPPDLRVFEAEAEEIRHQVQEVPAPPGVHNEHTKAERMRSMPKGA
jgi:hypothetical protein